MTVCVDSYVGEPGGGEGVKLEDQALIAGEGAVRLASALFEEDLL